MTIPTTAAMQGAIVHHHDPITVDETGRIFCGCGQPLAQYVEVAGETLIRLGGLELYAAHGRCGKCTRPYHFSSTERKLERLIASIR